MDIKKLTKNISITIYYRIILILLINSVVGSSWAEDRKNDQILTPKIYTIYHIALDETASSSRQARGIALRKAERTALDKLFRKIIREEDHDKLPDLSDGQVMELVSGIEVANEKSSHIRYIADFTVHFSRDKIYNFLSVLEIPFAETLSNAVNILTVLEKEGTVLLWEENNDWRKAWNSYDTVNNLVPIRMITPSLANRMAITAWQAQNGQAELLQKFTAAQNLRALYVMNASVITDPADGGDSLELTIFSNQGSGPDYKKHITLKDRSGDETDKLSALYNEAIRQATYWLDNRWKEKVMIHFGTSSHLKVAIKFDQSEDWFQIKKKLENISLIQRITSKKITIAGAEVDMKHSGEVEQIILALEQENLALTRQPDTVDRKAVTAADDHYWILTLKK